MVQTNMANGRRRPTPISNFSQRARDRVRLHRVWHYRLRRSMRTHWKHLKNTKGINTILASLLMVVIVVVASVMVYAWSTGLLGTLLVQPNVGKEALTMDTFAFPNNNNVTLTLRNAGTVAVTFSSYYVKNATGTTYTQSGWTW